ncbi:unnamed protein product [Pleuronectes platessa]|uniref:Uncharacterized protein n=1 Tax=Pleuronectes platessa TaxID=8262 RepID=A0A9N7V397_PLEPL|nr:unnamed protein product [Pleuronectes platessa]
MHEMREEAVAVDERLPALTLSENPLLLSETTCESDPASPRGCRGPHIPSVSSCRFLFPSFSSPCLPPSDSHPASLPPVLSCRVLGFAYCLGLLEDDHSTPQPKPPT